VAAKRARDKLDNVYGLAMHAISTIGHMLDHSDTAWAAAKHLDAMRHLTQSFLPATTRWWRCKTCKKAVMMFLPNEETCKCGEAARWQIQS